MVTRDRKVSSALTRVLLLLSVIVLGLSLLGFGIVSMRGMSMEPAAPAGSLLITRTTAPERLITGDIIVFPYPSSEFPHVAHRVAAIAKESGRIIAVTKGDKNEAPDPELLVLEDSVPRVVLITPYLGFLVTPNLAWQTVLAIGVFLAMKAALGLVGRRGQAAESRMTSAAT